MCQSLKYRTSEMIKPGVHFSTATHEANEACSETNVTHLSQQSIIDWWPVTWARTPSRVKGWGGVAIIDTTWNQTVEQSHLMTRLFQFIRKQLFVPALILQRWIYSYTHVHVHEVQDSSLKGVRSSNISAWLRRVLHMDEKNQQSAHTALFIAK